MEIDRVVKAGSARDAAGTREYLRQQVLEAAEGPEQSRTRVGEYAKRWASRKARELRPSTKERYAHALEHICGWFGDHYIDVITPDDIVRWRNEQDGAPSSVNGRLRIFKSMMKAATYELQLDRDPTLMVRATQDSKHDEGGNVLTAEELGTLLSFIRTERPHWYPFFTAAALTGARFGELSALRWEDLDHASGHIHIQRAQVRGQVGGTKTGSRRKVPMPAYLSEVLQNHRQILVAKQAPGVESGYIFPNRRGRLMANSSPTSTLARLDRTQNHL